MNPANGGTFDRKAQITKGDNRAGAQIKEKDMPYLKIECPACGKKSGIVRIDDFDEIECDGSMYEELEGECALCGAKFCCDFEAETFNVKELE